MTIELTPDWYKKMVGVVSCSCCKGKGIVERKEIVSYHNNDYDYWNDLCYVCDGEGRIIEYEYAFAIKFEDPVQKKNKVTQSYTHIVYEKFEGRKISDIYTIGRK